MVVAKEEEGEREGEMESAVEEAEEVAEVAVGVVGPKVAITTAGGIIVTKAAEYKGHDRTDPTDPFHIQR